MKHTFVTEISKLVPQILAVVAGTISAISDGMHYGWTSPVAEVLARNETHIHLTDEDHKWLESVYIFGGICGLPLTILFVDRIGRKQCILCSAVVALISWILIAVANNVVYFYVARFIVGISGDVAFVAAPMYVAEIADEKIRGFLAGVIHLMMLLGILLIYSIAPYTPFYVPSLIGGILLTIQILTFPFVPDSPYYLITNGKEENAKNDLKRLRAKENVDREIAEITAAVKRQKAEKGRPLDLIKGKGNRKAVLIMFLLNFAQHFGSISVILMNLHPILKAANSIYVSSNMAGILFAAIMLVAATIGDLIVDKFGRKILLTLSSILTGICLFVLAVYFTLQKNDFDVKHISWVPIAAVMVYAFVFKLGLGIIPIVMTAELFPAKVKAMGMTAADCFYEFFAWLSIEVYLRLTVHAGYDYPFYIFSICCFLVAGFSTFYIPETRGKTLEEIQFILKGIPLPLRNKSLTPNDLPPNGTGLSNCNNSHMDMRSMKLGFEEKNLDEKV